MIRWFLSFQFFCEDLKKPFLCLAFNPRAMSTLGEEDEPEVTKHSCQRDINAILRMGIVIPVNGNHRAGDMPAVRQKVSPAPVLLDIIPYAFGNLILAGNHIR